MKKLWCRVSCAVLLAALSGKAAVAAEQNVPPALEKLAADFWQWRARTQPYSTDDIPRLERPPESETGPRDWSAASIEKQERALGEFEKRWQGIDPTGWSVAQQVDYRLIGSALARVRWELEINARWKRDPLFYVDQTMTALLESVVQPPPFDAARSREILDRMRDVPKILADGKANLHPLRPFAVLAIGDLEQIRPEMERVVRELGPMLTGDGTADAFQEAAEKAAVALESYRDWLKAGLSAMPETTAVGRENYEFFLQKVALLPYSPETLLAVSRQEWDRSVAFEQFEKQRNQGLPELKIATSLQEQVARSKRDELTVRRFLEDKGIVTVPADVGHYTIQAMPGYVEALQDFGETDDFTGPSRLKEDGVRWIQAPSPNLGYFWLSTAKDPRPDMVHEGVPGHYFQMCISWRHPDMIRRHYYDSGSNEGLGFYTEEMLLEAGLFDDSPRSREIVYNFMRLRALRVEVDVKLALGEFTIDQAADYLAAHVPMDRKTARAEAALFATTPGQAISYQIGKSQIMHFLADAKLSQGEKFSLRAFHDFVWLNGNVPIALLRWEYLGKDDEVREFDRQRGRKEAR